MFVILVESTTLRSVLIAGCFFAYGLGCIAVNIVTIWVDSATQLIFIAGSGVIISVLPSFFTFFETPQFLLKKGRFNELIDCLTSIAKINGKGLDKEEFYLQFIDKDEISLVKDEEVRVKKIKEKEDNEFTHSFKLLVLSKK